MAELKALLVETTPKAPVSPTRLIRDLPRAWLPGRSETTMAKNVFRLKEAWRRWERQTPPLPLADEFPRPVWDVRVLRDAQVLALFILEQAAPDADYPGLRGRTAGWDVPAEKSCGFFRCSQITDARKI